MTDFLTSRRTFLRLATGAAGLLVGCGRDNPLASSDEADGLWKAALTTPESVAASYQFPMGVSSGDVTNADAVLNTRYAGDKPLRCVVWKMSGAQYAAVAGEVDCTVAEAGFVHVDLQNLEPSERYRYVFFELDENGQAISRSNIGRFRAAPADDSLEPLVFGAISCVKYGYSFQTLTRAAERTDLDAFLLLGDTVYNDGAVSIEQYRDRWFQSMSTQQWMALRESVSVFATWDDHEVSNNWNAAGTDAAKIAMATKAWFENIPVRRQSSGNNRIYRSVKWGKTAELFALDCRSERDSSRGLYVSRSQMDWLKNGLAASNATFKIILNSVPIGAFPWPLTLVNRDRWQGFPTQRQEIVSHIDTQKISGVLWLSGDFHLGSMGRLEKTGLGSNMVEVLAGPGANSHNPALLAVRGSQFDFVTGENNYVALHLDPATKDCRVVFHDGSGLVLADRTYRL
ncbi:MAG: alkaline phosphatase D family protein [Myxococcaceae bacterium]